MDIEPRIDPPLQVDERASLAAFLDYQRATVLRKVQGLSKDELNRVGVATTTLTLAGLVKHLALVEDSWFQEVFLGRPLPEPWAGAPFARTTTGTSTALPPTSRRASSRCTRLRWHAAGPPAPLPDHSMSCRWSTRSARARLSASAGSCST